MIIPLVKAPEQVCGECTLCCKVMGVKDGYVDADGVDHRTFDKPKDQWCQHAKKSVGCNIYKDRPTACRDFSCIWLRSGQRTHGAQGLGQAKYRPDRLHGVITPTTDGHNFVLHEDPGYPRAARTTLKDVLHAFTADGEHYVVVVCGTERAFIGRREIYDRLVSEGNHPMLVK